MRIEKPSQWIQLQNEVKFEFNGAKWSQMKPNGAKWSQMKSHDAKWSQMMSNGGKYS